MTRLKENLRLYKDAVAESLGSLETRENLIEYNGRYIYLKCVPCEMAGHSAYAYVGLDVERKSFGAQKTFQCTKDRKMDAGQVHRVFRPFGNGNPMARYDISKAAIDRLTEHVSAFTQDERLGSVLSLAGFPLMSNSKKFRAVDAFGKD